MLSAQNFDCLSPGSRSASSSLGERFLAVCDLLSTVLSYAWSLPATDGAVVQFLSSAVLWSLSFGCSSYASTISGASPIWFACSLSLASEPYSIELHFSSDGQSVPWSSELQLL